MSRFVLCGICGTEDSCKTMLPMAKATQLTKECLPLKNAYKKLSRGNSEFAKSVKQDFTKYGILVNAEHLCKYCSNKLRCNSKSTNSSKSVRLFVIEDESDESGKIIEYDTYCFFYPSRLFVTNIVHQMMTTTLMTFMTTILKLMISVKIMRLIMVRKITFHYNLHYRLFKGYNMFCRWW